MAHGRTVVFVHGKGGPEDPSRWLDPLNAGLTALGYPRLAAPADHVIAAEYLDQLLAGEAGDEPAVTWEPPGSQARHEEWDEYLVRSDVFARTLATVRNDPRGVTPHGFSDTVVPDVVASAMAAVTHYAHSRRHRHAAWRAVLAQLPTQGGVVVIAHSLGSIVMLDLLRRLPADLQIDLLVTIGSPMGVPLLRSHHGGIEEADAFPASRVRAWVNVFDPGDLVTVGRGASRYFAAALDQPIHTGGAHTLAAYMSHPVTAAAVGLALFGPPAAASEPHTPVRGLDPRWEPLLLNFAFTQALWTTCDTDKWGFRRRLDTARRTLAQRTVSGNERLYEASIRRAEAATGAERSALLLEAAQSPVAPRRCPTEDDLLVHAASLLHGRLSVDDLVIASVELLLTPPLPPFDVDIDRAHARDALRVLLESAAIPGLDVPAADTAEHLAAAVKEARDALAESGFPWGRVLIGAGIGLMALTGVGLALAAPVGLAGAAAIASTLATFGPGGMVGGIATLTALTGVATAAAVAGTAIELRPGDPGYETVRAAMASQLADLPSAQLRTSVAGMLAVVSARRRLGRPVDASPAEELLLETEAIVRHETAMHETVAPGRAVTKDWRTKQRILTRALEWLAQQGDDVGLPELERAQVRLEIEGAPPE